jgi:RNase P subunit RPR2
MSLPAAYARSMIDLGSIAGLHEHDHELRAYCLRCDRWAVLPLANLVSLGKGSLRMPITVRCQQCGERGQLQVRPPMPAWTNTNGWMELRQDSTVVVSHRAPA